MVARNNIRAYADARIAEASEMLALITEIERAEVEVNRQAGELSGLKATNTKLSQDLFDLNRAMTLLTDENVRLKAEIAQLKPAKPFILADATRQQWLGMPASMPISYESEVYPASLPQEQRPTTAISRDFVRATTMPRWRMKYPTAPRWCADIEWQWRDNVFTAEEVQRVLPAFQGARDFADAERKGLKLGGYGFTHRFGLGVDPARIKAQIEVYRPILDLLDEAHITLYAIYFDIEQSRQYIRENIAMAREAMPGKPVICLLWPAWHGNVKSTHPELPGTPISPGWWRMALETCHEHADGLAIWTKAAAPQPTNEPWWLETQSWRAVVKL